MGHSGGNNREWLSSLHKIMEADTLLKNRSDENIIETLSYEIGFPLDSANSVSIHEFWEILVKNLRANGYRIIDDIYIDTNDDEELKHRRKLIEEINRYVNK